ncbi:MULTISPECIES: pyocin S6 family toxin immunity protein [unclassified Pseudomonas]|uniref:pyocin S6 family toxin immunity protein n=1 Tax=unclassified Pseudomonas TaxID=196821 RepID=UPI002AC961A9|nr:MULTISPECIES: pyocin S6 family toxin immunity protein [unclassified Pseudomonas]MEB0042215.1 pyocin S6 family toxin immunity protein [Pseudomonas sp. MH10]MEB0119332.1 pyocin S6 family toxin immunity protein [Pseudomonas sp. CCI1.2]WPX65891.1 pyocin S6 family toxin immunity protein [Pseudomonas sp. MH10]
MFLWISGFLKGDDEDDSLKYDLVVQPNHEVAVIRILGWNSLNESPDGEWLLTIEQTQQIRMVINEQLPTNLDLFIGVRA